MTTDRADVPLYWKVMVGVCVVAWLVLFFGLPAAMWARALIGTWDKAITDALWVTWTFGIIAAFVLSCITWWIGDDKGYF